MADEELELAEEGGKSKKKLFLIIGIVAVLLLGGGAAAFFLIGGEEPAPAEGDEAVVEEEVIKEAIYVSLEPAFTVNLQGGSKAKYLQVTMEVLVRGADLEEAVKTHTPAIRNQLVLMMSNKTSQELDSLEGKQALQAEALKTVQDVVKTAEGLEGIEAVFFTTFVMQ